MLSGGCGDDEEATSATVGATTVPDLPPPDPNCAGIDGFASGHGPGLHYGCDGSVQGELRFTVCDENAQEEYDCAPSQESNKTVLIDSNETEGADGTIPFASDDPTGGPLVEACCEDSIETVENGEEAGDSACLLDCAYAACNDALARFKALEADPPDDECPPDGIAHTVCVNNIQQSVTFWRTILEDNFDACVAAVASPNPNHIFMLGSAGCVQNAGALKGGCFADAVLDLKCVEANVNLETGTGSCSEAKNQPPSTSRMSCDIAGGEVEIADVAGAVYPAVESGTATTTYFDCGEASCTFMVNSMNLVVEDVDYGSSDLEDIQVQLQYPAAGQSDGADVEFPPGSIWVRVTGNVVDVTGSTPFDVVAGNTVTAYGAHDVDALMLEDVIFEADVYTFTASIEESECEAL